MQSELVRTMLNFVDKINYYDIQGVIDLLAQDHVFIDMQGDQIQGKQEMTKAWRNYLENFPDYKIYIRRIFKRGDEIALLGHTTGSHLKIQDVYEFHGEGVIWLAKVNNGKLSLWQLYNDTLDNRNKLNLDQGTEIYAPQWKAATIAKHLDLLPAGSRTKDVRNVRKYYSRLYRHAPPEIMLAIAESLLFDQGYRFVPYELIFYHKGCIELLDPERVKSLGQGINDWSSTDIFARFIAGPAWKQGIITDELIEDWIRSPILWWRRAAVVSTIYLHGDVDRMIKYSKLLVEDKEDKISKALSWVLRSAIKYDRQAVKDFLTKYEPKLDARIKREVRNKLVTGLKNP
jgi:3-methyladenine DNA glycosylase AlkD/limonene-1,2-epoxide hydrolase